MKMRMDLFYEKVFNKVILKINLLREKERLRVKEKETNKA